MSKTIVALFHDVATAHQVVEDLVKAGFKRDCISLITNDSPHQYSDDLNVGDVSDDVPKEDAVSAMQGAGFGAVVGALMGILVGLGVLVIPGIDPAIIAEPVVAALTGGVAGAITGVVVGALVKSRVPEDEAPYYAEGIRRGATLVSIETNDTNRAEDILQYYGSINIHERMHIWRQTGWSGFDPNAAPLAVTMMKPLTSVVRSGAVAWADGIPVVIDQQSTPQPLLMEAPPVEPSINEEDTAKSVPVIVNNPHVAPELPRPRLSQMLDDAIAKSDEADSILRSHPVD